MGSPCGNDAYNVAPQRENDEVCFSGDLSNRLAALFLVVASPIHALETTAVRKYKRRVCEIEAATRKRTATFRFVPFEYHMGGIAV
jgi:hypothetical protein